MAFIGIRTLLVGISIIAAVSWDFALRDLLLVQRGIGRTVQPISDFPYTCRRIRGPSLEACEDMWLSERTRKLYLACSEAQSRRDWMPNVARLDVSKRSSGDKLLSMDIDKPVGDGFEYDVLKIADYTGTSNDGHLHLVGLTGNDRGDSIDLFIVNNRPSIDPVTGYLLDQTQVGANSTIEVFRVDDQSDGAKHIRTYAHPQIATPNNIAPVSDGSFYFTNDHGVNKVGWRHQLSLVLKTGDVSFCDKMGQCKRVAKGYAFPNGLLMGKDGLLYVPSTVTGNVVVYKPKPDGELKKVETIYVPYPLDNLSEDANGDLWVAGLPRIDQTLAAFDDPLGAATPAATMLRIRKKEGGGYEYEKALEDSEGELVPAATVVVHDAKTGRLFVGGVISPFITMCEPKRVEAAGANGHSEL